MCEFFVLVAVERIYFFLLRYYILYCVSAVAAVAINKQLENWVCIELYILHFFFVNFFCFVFLVCAVSIFLYFPHYHDLHVIVAWDRITLSRSRPAQYKFSFQLVLWRERHRNETIFYRCLSFFIFVIEIKIILVIEEKKMKFLCSWSNLILLFVNRLFILFIKFILIIFLFFFNINANIY